MYSKIRFAAVLPVLVVSFAVIGSLGFFPHNALAQGNQDCESIKKDLAAFNDLIRVYLDENDRLRAGSKIRCE